MNFSFDTIQDFESHIEKSIPGYKQLNDFIISISAYFINNSTIIDLGCSTGYLLDKLSRQYPNNTFIGLDISDNLFEQANVSDKVSLRKCNIVQDDFPNADLITCIFVLQFLPISERLTLLKKVYNKLPIGGAFIVAEKIYQDSGKAQDIFNFSHYDYKQKSFSEYEIFAKQKDLRLIMKPLYDSENVNIIKQAGFSDVISFWQNLSFKCWICIK